MLLKFWGMMESRCKWVRLGDYIEMRHENNSSLKYGAELIEGINSNGEFQATKAITENINLKPYKVVRHGDIVYNPSRLNIGSLAYRIGEMCIVSHLYQVFYVKEEYTSILSAEFLTLYLRRSEFYRYVDYDNYGSQRAEYNLRKLGELRIPLPSLAEQQKVVNAWKALREIKEQNEEIAAPLMQVCQSYIQELKHKYESVEIGEFIEESEERNKQNEFGATELMGVNCEGKIVKSIANTQGLNFSNYKIVHNGDFAYSNRINVGSIALNRGNDCIISPSYVVFRVCRKDIIMSEYLDMWYRRTEFLRSTYFFAFGTIKDDFSIREMKRSRIPLPPLSVQQAIVNIYNCANEAKKIAAEADRMSREVCPALIQHVVNNN